MIKVALVSFSPMLLPASCWTAQCACEWICPMLGMVGCVAVAGMAAAALFAVFAFVNAMAGLDAIRD